MKKSIIKLISVILGITIMLSLAISAHSYNIRELQNKVLCSYYSDINELAIFDSEFYSNNASILEGSVINRNDTVRIYNSIYDLTLKSNFNDFVMQYNSGKKISDLIYDSGALFSTVYDEATRSYSTAFMTNRGGKIMVDAVYVNDNGAIFKIPESKNFVSELSRLNGKNALDCKFVVLTGITSGILVSDGTQELFIVISPSRCFDVGYGTVLTADELVEKITDNQRFIINGISIFDVNNDGEINYIIG